LLRWLHTAIRVAELLGCADQSVGDLGHDAACHKGDMVLSQVSGPRAWGMRLLMGRIYRDPTVEPTFKAFAHTQPWILLPLADHNLPHVRLHPRTGLEKGCAAHITFQANSCLPVKTLLRCVDVQQTVTDCQQVSAAYSFMTVGMCGPQSDMG